MGLDIYLEWPGMTEEEKEARHTGFKNSGACGYLRSSYNEGGFNNWAKTYIQDKDFYYIFNPLNDGEDWMPLPEEWDSMMIRANEALELAKKASEMPCIMTVHLTKEIQPNKDAAIKAFLEEKEKNCDFGWYSNHKGEFFLKDSPKVLGVMKVKGYFGDDIVFIYESGETSPHQYYIDLLEHDVRDFIKLGKEKMATIIWSG